MEPFLVLRLVFREPSPASQILLLCRMAAANQVSFRVSLPAAVTLLQSGQESDISRKNSSLRESIWLFILSYNLFRSISASCLCLCRSSSTCCLYCFVSSSSPRALCLASRNGRAVMPPGLLEDLTEVRAQWSGNRGVLYLYPEKLPAGQSGARTFRQAVYLNAGKRTAPTPRRLAPLLTSAAYQYPIWLSRDGRTLYTGL